MYIIIDMIKLSGVYYLSIDNVKSNRMNIILQPVFGKNFRKIHGVNGNKLNIQQIKNKKLITNHGITLFNYKHRPYGTLGCYLAHTSMWQMLYKHHKQTGYVLILEDDVILANDFWHIFNTTTEYIPKDTDIIYFDYNKLLCERFNKFFNKPINNAPNGHNALLSCYMLKVASIPKLLDVCLPIGKDTKANYFAIDAVLRNNFHKINALFCKKKLAKQLPNIQSTRLFINNSF